MGGNHLYADAGGRYTGGTISGELTFGGKRAYVWTLSAFLLGSLLCGLAWNLPSLIFFRHFLL